MMALFRAARIDPDPQRRAAGRHRRLARRLPMPRDAIAVFDAMTDEQVKRGAHLARDAARLSRRRSRHWGRAMASAPSEPRAVTRPHRQGRAAGRGRPGARGAAARGRLGPRPDPGAAAGRGGRASSRGSSDTPVSRPAIAASSRPRHRAVGSRASRRRRDRLVARRLDGARPRPVRATALCSAAPPKPRPGSARHEWAADEELRLISLSGDLAELLGIEISEAAGQPLTRILRLEENDDGEMPLISALAARRGFTGQRAAQPRR